MATDVQTQTLLKGGEWIIRETIPGNVFTPEDFNEEQKIGHGYVPFFPGYRNIPGTGQD
jgi:hypothetical protein